MSHVYFLNTIKDPLVYNYARQCDCCHKFIVGDCDTNVAATIGDNMSLDLTGVYHIVVNYVCNQTLSVLQGMVPHVVQRITACTSDKYS